MRAVFGLVGILAVAFVLIWWLKGPGGDHLQSVATVHKETGAQARQLAGQDAQTGGRAADSASFEVITAGGRPDSILVTQITPGGAFQRYFGLKENDTIIAIELQGTPMKVSETGDEEMAKAQVQEAYSRQGRLHVMRDGNPVVLPEAAAPGAPAPAGGRSGSDPLQQQLDGIGARRGL